MYERQTPSGLLEAIYDTGEAMRAALTEDDLALFSELVEAREALVAELGTHTRPSEPDPAWREVAEKLSAQREALAAATAAHEERLRHALGDTRRVRRAQRSYGQPPPTGRILHDGLHG